MALAAHPDDPPVERLREAARSINQPAKYDRLIALHPSPMNQLELCLGSVQEMTEGSVYDVVDRYARERRIAYIHFRNVRGKVPRYLETFVDEGDIDMARIVRSLKEHGYDGVLIPDHNAGDDLRRPLARRHGLCARLHAGPDPDHRARLAIVFSRSPPR